MPCTDVSPLSDQHIDEIIAEIKNDPNDGEVMMNGHLLRMGIQISRQKLRNSIHRIDNANTVARRHFTVRRRAGSTLFHHPIIFGTSMGIVN